MSYITSFFFSLSNTFCQKNTKQQHHTDTITIDRLVNLDEITVFGKHELNTHTKNQLSSIDRFLEQSPSINMIKRGGYAWEPILNGMPTERSRITIDGMQIFSACTDKMDPITSYIETTNLSSVDIYSGQNGNIYGMSAAGSINLVSKKSQFGHKGFSGHSFLGYESAHQQKITGIALQNSQERYYSDINFTFRDATNYKAGGNIEIPYSQFTKYNMSTNVGYKVNSVHTIEGTAIYDHATDVGYPALPMDVSTAKAGIFSLQHTYTPTSNDSFQGWNTKIYYNTITHIMDDSHRPNVPIRMDMPGWSRTYGFYSESAFSLNNHKLSARLSGYQNKSLAEMTMFSNTIDEKDMFMLTWPDVMTNYSHLHIADNIQLNRKLLLHLSTGIAYEHSNIKNEEGYESLKIFHPNMSKTKNRILKSFNSSISKAFTNLKTTFGVGYGERSPRISEAYGFYLFNSFDNYDYIGTPSLKNEKSFEANLELLYTNQQHTLLLKSNYFHIRDYIIGKPIHDLSSMTIGSNGVKIYSALDYARLFNLSITTNIHLVSDLQWHSTVSYRSGKDFEQENLPMIQPFNYDTEIIYQINGFNFKGGLTGSAKHTAVSSYYGEQTLSSYTLVHIAGKKIISLPKSNQQLHISIGIDNLLDKYYTTFADWNRIPQMGRNIYSNILFKF